MAMTVASPERTGVPVCMSTTMGVPSTMGKLLRTWARLSGVIKLT
jgi:hypothetical protein